VKPARRVFTSIGMAALLIITVVLTLALSANFGNQQINAQAAVSPVVAQPTATPTPGNAPAQSATATQINLNPSRLVTVSTVGQIQSAPDVAYLNVGSDVKASTAREALDKAKANAEALRKAAIAAGVADDDIKTSSISVYPYSNPSKDGTPPSEPTGYQANVNLTITINDLSKAGAILDAATKAGANQIGGVTYGIKDDSSLRAQALEQAVKQARPKAEAIARGMNLQLGPVITITEDPNGYYPSVPGAAMGKGDNGLSPGQLTVAVRVTVSFAIQ
jgi:uncharacterized protein